MLAQTRQLSVEAGDLLDRRKSELRQIKASADLAIRQFNLEGWKLVVLSLGAGAGAMGAAVAIAKLLLALGPS